MIEFTIQEFCSEKLQVLLFENIYFSKYNNRGIYL